MNSVDNIEVQIFCVNP